MLQPLYPTRHSSQTQDISLDKYRSNLVAALVDELSMDILNIRYTNYMLSSNTCIIFMRNLKLVVTSMHLADAECMLINLLNALVFALWN